MRQAGSFANQVDAQRFAAYLITQGIAAHAEHEAGEWVIWIRDEDHLARAKDELRQFRNHSSDARYNGVERTAAEIRREEERLASERRKNIVEVRNRWGGSRLRATPLTTVLIGLSIAVSVFSGMGENTDGTILRTLLFQDSQARVEQLKSNELKLTPDELVKLSESANPQREILKRLTAGDLLSEIKRGEIWRLVTPIFIHFGVIHLVFNMYMFYQLGALIELRRGTASLGLMILAMAVLSNVAQALAPAEWGGGNTLFGGMSGVVYGLLGYAWMKTKFDPFAGILIRTDAVVIMLIWFLICVFGFLPNIGNWAHGVGFVSGLAIGYAPVLFRKQ